MARDKKTEKTDLSAIDEALAGLTDKQLKFWRNMHSGKMTQVQAYKDAFDTKPDTHDKNIAVDACKLWNSPKFTLIRSALVKGVTQLSKRSLEERIARMEELRQIAIESGNIGAAFQCEQALGKLEGHYVEKSESVTRTIDYAETIKALEGHIPENTLNTFKEQLGITDIIEGETIQ